MAITPIQLFTQPAQTNAAAQVAGLATANAAANTTGVNQATLGTFSAVLGQVLAQLGPLAFDTTLTNIGGGGNNTGTPVSGLTNTVFTLLLLNSLGLGQQTATQPAAQQLLLTQLLLSSTGTTDSLGLGSLAVEEFAGALAQQAGTSNTLLTQLAAASTQPNPIVFSAGVLAQAFQVGNGTGSPA